MPTFRRLLAMLLVLLPATLVPSSLCAAGFGVFQHGGRGAGQVGAFVARADDPTALSVNPAGLAGQIPDGVRWRIQAGIDFTAPRDDFESNGENYAAQHQINPPPGLYVAWVPGGSERWTLGVGFDTPFWNNTEWLPALFPLRTANSKTQILLFELHPAAAFDLGSGWSVGGGVRYVIGKMELGKDRTFETPTGERIAVIELSADGDVDGVGFDLGVRRASERFGYGARVRSAVEVSGDGDVGAFLQPGVPPAYQSALNQILDSYLRSTARLEFELPLDVTVGAWRQVGNRLRVEADVSWQGWSSTGNRVPILNPCDPAASCLATTDRDWDDTLNVRVGAEFDLRQNLQLYAGVALEQSPVNGATLEPGFARGDAKVLAAGIGYEIPSAKIRFDFGYSFHQHDDVRYGRNDVIFGAPSLPAPVSGTFSAHDQAFSFSVRRDF